MFRTECHGPNQYFDDFQTRNLSINVQRMTLILIRMLVHISKILTVSLTQKHVFSTKHVYALSPSVTLVIF